MFAFSQNNVAFWEKQLNKTARLSSIIWSNMEQCAALQMTLNHQVLTKNTQWLEDLSQLKEAKDWMDVYSQKVTSTLEDIASNAHRVYDLALTAQNDVMSVFKDDIAEMAKACDAHKENTGNTTSSPSSSTARKKTAA